MYASNGGGTRTESLDDKGMVVLPSLSMLKNHKVCPVVPPKSNRREPWEYDKELYKGRNVVERNFRNIKQFRRVYTRYDKLDETYNAFISIANIVIFMRNQYQHALGMPKFTYE